MSDKNFKVKNGLTIQGEVDTLITADNAGGILVNGEAVGGLPSLGGGSTTEDLSIALNVPLDLNYDIIDNPSFVIITPYGTIDDAAIAEFNTDLPVGTNFTLSFTNSMNNPPASYLTTFTKTGAAENVMGMQIKIPVEHVSGDTILFSFGNAVTIEYGQSNAGKFLTNDGTTSSWGDLKSSASGSLSGSGTASWSSYPVNTYPAGNPYGIKTINGQKRVVMPNVANFEAMPIGSTITFSDEYFNNGIGASPIVQTLTTTGLYDGNGFDISGDPFDTTTDYPGGNHTFYISWTGTEPEHAITADDLRLLSPDAAGSVHQQLDMLSSKTVEIFNSSNRTIATTHEWKVPGHVEVIKVTLTGPGGTHGPVSISKCYPGTCLSYSTSGYDANVPTWFIDPTSQYVAYPGATGGSFSLSGSESLSISAYDTGIAGGSGGGDSQPMRYVGSYPGAGAGPKQVDLVFSTAITFSNNSSNSDPISYAESKSWQESYIGYPGEDGEEKVFYIKVVPGSTIQYQIGEPNTFTGGRPGQVMIEY